MTDIAALQAELENDPAILGYAPLLAQGAAAAVAGLLNAQNFTMLQPVTWATVVEWGASIGLRSKIQDASVDATNTARDVALTFLDFVGALGIKTAGSEGTLDVTDPFVVGAVADGSTYTPGAGAVTTPGLLDGLIGAQSGSPLAANPILTQAQKDILITLGTVPASRAMILWGFGTVVADNDVSTAWAANYPNGQVPANASAEVHSN